MRLNRNSLNLETGPNPLKRKRSIHHQDGARWKEDLPGDGPVSLGVTPTAGPFLAMALSGPCLDASRIDRPQVQPGSGGYVCSNSISRTRCKQAPVSLWPCRLVCLLTTPFVLRFAV